MEPKNSPACVELSSKSKVPEGPVSSWSREQCVDWLKDIGVPHSGTKEDLIKKILKFQKYPTLLKKIKDRANRNCKFLTSLSPSDIPPSTSLWKQEKCPKVNKSIFESYCEHKRQGIAGQQQKAHRLFSSRKVVTVFRKIMQHL